jgi:acetoin utilization protein AcuA
LGKIKTGKSTLVRSMVQVRQEMSVMAQGVRELIRTGKGRVSIETNVGPDHFQDLVFDPGFTGFGRYTPIYTEKKSLETIIQKGGQVSLALLNSWNIVGFCVLAFPESCERWAGLGLQHMKELAGIEVVREFRGAGIAQRLLSRVLSDPQREHEIVYLTGYSWTWDLEYSGLSAEAYRRMLVHLYSQFGFKEYLTNEPNVCLKPENIFMARIGVKVPHEVRENFRWVRFGVL